MNAQARGDRATLSRSTSCASRKLTKTASNVQFSAASKASRRQKPRSRIPELRNTAEKVHIRRRFLSLPDFRPPASFRPLPEPCSRSSFRPRLGFRPPASFRPRSNRDGTLEVRRTWAQGAPAQRLGSETATRPLPGSLPLPNGGGARGTGPAREAGLARETRLGWEVGLNREAGPAWEAGLAREARLAWEDDAELWKLGEFGRAARPTTAAQQERKAF